MYRKGEGMKKLKDLIYDYNDIFVAILIVILAGLIISWRISDIMAYPQYLAKQNAGEITDNVDIDLSLTDVDDINDNPEDIVTDPTTDSGIDNPPIEVPPTPPIEGGEFITAKDASFTVPTGVSSKAIAQLLYDANLVESPEHFNTAVAKKNAETKLKAGTFKIAAGSTVEDIIAILTR